MAEITYAPQSSEVPTTAPLTEEGLQKQELTNKFDSFTTSPEMAQAMKDDNGANLRPFGTDLTQTEPYQQQESRVKAMLYDPINLGGQAEQAILNSQKTTDSQGYRDQVASYAAVAHLTGSPIQDVVDNFGFYQSALEKQYNFDPTDNVGTFRNNIAGVFQQHDKRVSALDGLKSQAINDAFEDADKGMSVPALTRFSNWQSSHEDALKGLSESERFNAFNSVYKPIQQALNTPEGALAKRFVDALTGNTKEAKASDYSKEFPTFTDPKQYLRGLNADDQTKVLTLARQYLKKQGADSGVLAELNGLADSFSASAESYGRITDVHTLIKLEEQRDAATDPAEKDKFQQQYNDILLAQKVRQFATAELNAPPAHYGWKGSVSKVASGVVGMIPQVLPFMVPYVGEVAFGLNEVSNLTLKHMQENPNMTARESFERSIVPAALSTVIGTKAIKLLGKVAPSVVGVIKHFAGSTVLLSTAEGVKTLYAQLEHAWNKDINAGQQFAAEYLETLKNVPYLFVELGIFGAAAHIASRGGKVDPEVATQAAKNAADPMALKEQGFSHDEATRISDLPEDQRLQAIGEGWDKRTKEDIAAGTQLIKDNYQQIVDTINAPDAPKLVNNFDGTFRVTTVDAEGKEHASTFTDQEAAETAFTMAMQDHLIEKQAKEEKDGNDWTGSTAEDAKTVLDEGRQPEVAQDPLPDDTLDELPMGKDPVPTTNEEVKQQLQDFLSNRASGESGFLDITPIYDKLSEYGKSIYEKGQTFADWSKRMISEFGEKVKSVLGKIWNGYKSLGNAGSIGGKADDFAARVEKAKTETKAEIMQQAGIDESGLAFLREAVGDAKTNLEKKQSRREGTGVAKNQLTRFHDSDGRTIVVGADPKQGGKPFEDWVKENDQWLKPAEIADFRKWYTELKGNFTHIFGEDAPTMMMAWLAAQQNVSPSGALGNVFKVEDRLAGIGTGKKGGLADEKIEGILTNTIPEKGFGQKLTDFVDAGFQRPTRTYMGEHLAGGMPFVADVHTGRDSGHVDQQTLTRLKEMADEGNLFVGDKSVSIDVLESKTVTKKMEDGSTKETVQPERISVKIKGKKPFDMFVDQRGSPSDGNYEGISEWGNNLTDHLNKQEWEGGGWNPAEVQAVGWMRILRQYGLPEPTVATALAHNTTHIYAEVNYSKGNRLPAAFPDLSTLPMEAQTAITHQVISTAVPELAQIIGGSMRVRSVSATNGRWGGESSPSTAIEVLASSESAALLGNALALVSEQGGSMTAIFEKGGKNSSAIFFHPEDGGKLTPEQLESLAKEAGISGMTVQPYRDGERVMLVGTKKGTLTPKGLTEKQRDDMTQKISAWAEREGVDLIVDRTQTTIDANENNWNTQQEGENYRQRLIDGGGNSKVRDILNFRGRYAEIVNDAIEQHAPDSLTGTREERLSRFSDPTVETSTGSESAPSNGPPSKEQQAANIRSRLKSQGGFIDPTILEDIYRYGEGIYKKGVEYVDFAKQMISDLGNHVAGVLKQLYDAYNDAYKGSRFSSEAGSINITPIIRGVTPPPPTLREKTEESLTRLKSTMRDLPAASPFKKALLKWSARSQRSTNDIERAQHDIETVAPQQATREGITNWIEAGGDKSLLRLRANGTTDPKLKAGYDAALAFTPEQEKLAGKIQQTFDVLKKRAEAYGIEMGYRENYVPHVYKTEPQPPSGSTPKRLDEFFKFSQERTFDSYHEGEQHGYEPETKDIAKLLGLYMNDMNNAINSRRFVEELRGLKGADGRPLVSARGSGKETTTANGTTHLVYPDAADEGTEDYKKLDQPALHDWKFAGQDSSGNNVLTKGDLAVHPEIAQHLNNALSSSAITRYLGTKTENPFHNAVKGTANVLLKAQSYVKGTMLSLSPFHQVQEGIHAIGHRVSPFNGLPKIDLRDPAQRDASEHGLMLAHDRLSQSLFMEGVGDNNSNLLTMGLRKIGWGVSTKAADTLDAYQHYLFSQYIPALKFNTYTHILERNMDRYKADLAAGKVDEWQIKNLSARQSNAAYGHLNYTDMGHNPTIRHAAQIILLAPDFLEARARFVGQAAKGLVGGKVGTEQLQALAFLAMTQFIGARIFNKLTNDDYEWKHPFEIRVDNKYYGLRSVPEDMYKLVSNTTGFIGGRISPLFGKFVQEGVFGVNYRGERTSVGDAIGDIMAGVVPMALQPLVSEWTSTGRAHDLSWWEQILASGGVQIHRYSPITTVYPMAHDWVKANYPEDVQKGSYPVSKYQQLRYALEDNDTEKAHKEVDKLIAGGMKKHDVATGFKSSIDHPFTGSTKHDKEFYKSLDEDDQQRYKAAVERRKEILHRFHSMNRVPADSEEATSE